MVPKWYLDQHTPFRCCGCCWPTRTTSEPHWEFHATVPDLLLLSELVVIIVAGSDSGSGTSAPESKRDADETCSERPALYTTIERSTCGGCTTQQKICELPATVWQFVGGSIKRHFVCWCDEMMTICCCENSLYGERSLIHLGKERESVMQVLHSSFCWQWSSSGAPGDGESMITVIS